MFDFWFSIAQPIRFLTVGAINTLNGYILIMVAQYGLGSFYRPQVIFIMAFLIASIPAFIGMRFLVFRTPGSYILQYIRHIASSLLSVAGGAFSVYFSVKYFGLNPYYGQTIGVVISGIISFIALKYYAFARRRSTGIDPQNNCPALDEK